MSDVAIESVARFVAWLEEHGDRVAAPGNLWFRGHGNPGMELTPRVLRAAPGGRQSEPALIEREIALNKEFRRRAASLLPDRDDLVEIYFLAQHHGLPTRLLDWTTNPLAALFFAVSADLGSDGEVIVVWPQQAAGPSTSGAPPATAVEALPQRHPLVRAAVGCLFGQADCPQTHAILFVLPDLPVARMLQQGACFTLHLPGTGAIDDRGVIRLRVPVGQKPALQDSLRRMGVNWGTLFPDLDHVCRELRENWERR